jgi:hypothetical protein
MLQGGRWGGTLARGRTCRTYGNRGQTSVWRPLVKGVQHPDDSFVTAALSLDKIIQWKRLNSSASVPESLSLGARCGHFECTHAARHSRARKMLARPR